MVRIDHKILSGIELKRCSVCKLWLPLKAFSKNKTSWDGLSCRCYGCTKIYAKRHHEKNRTEIIAKRRQFYEANPEKVKENRERARKKCKEHPEKGRESMRRWRKNSPELNRQIQRRADIKKRSTLKGRLTINIRAALHRCLRSGKSGHTFEILGYSVEQLKKHLSKTMPQGYCWGDYLAGKLHIDHKIPVSAHNFKSTEDRDFGRCWALKNLQLLPAFDNISKFNKLDKHFQPSLIFKQEEP